MLQDWLAFGLFCWWELVSLCITFPSSPFLHLTNCFISIYEFFLTSALCFSPLSHCGGLSEQLVGGLAAAGLNSACYFVSNENARSLLELLWLLRRAEKVEFICPKTQICDASPPGTGKIGEPEGMRHP